MDFSPLSSPSSKYAANTPEIYLPGRGSEFHALSSYLRLRREHKSPSRSPSPTRSVHHNKDFFEDIQFDEIVSNADDVDADASSDNSLSFVEKVHDANDLDFTAMRLLVRTSLNEKEMAKSKVSVLDLSLIHI